jgi:hypothetical protein
VLFNAFLVTFALVKWDPYGTRIASLEERLGNDLWWFDPAGLSIVVLWLGFLTLRRRITPFSKGFGLAVIALSFIYLVLRDNDPGMSGP